MRAAYRRTRIFRSDRERVQRDRAAPRNRGAGWISARARGVVKTNPGASLIDLGDGVLCCEFHSKANAIGDDIMQSWCGRDWPRSGDQLRDAMVIGNQGENFSAWLRT